MYTEADYPADHPVDILEPIRCKIAFLADMIAANNDDSFYFSIDGRIGLFYIMRNMEDEIEKAQRELDNYKEVQA